MIEGVLIDDEGNTLYAPIGETGIKSVAPSKWKIWLSANWIGGANGHGLLARVDH